MRILPAHRKRRRSRADRGTVRTSGISLTRKSVRTEDALPEGDAIVALWPREAFPQLPALRSDERASKRLPAALLAVEIESPNFREFRRFCERQGIAWQKLDALDCPRQRVKDGNTGRWKELATGPSLLTLAVNGQSEALQLLCAQPWIARHFEASRISPPRLGSGAGDRKPIPRPRCTDHSRADSADRIATGKRTFKPITCDRPLWTEPSFSCKWEGSFQAYSLASL